MRDHALLAVRGPGPWPSRLLHRRVR
jgi:hypothetical protein